jgi:uncharacterized pyridoxal phosphate-containing UPF0001 family protein
VTEPDELDELDEHVTERLAGLRRRIVAAGRDPAGVQVVAVTKAFGLAEVQAARRAGLEDLGENYAGELLEKAVALAATGDSGARWHFLGAVQRNKVARLAPVVACWQAVDRLEEGEAIARHAPGARILVEVDLTGLPGRGGVSGEEVPALVAGLRRLDLDVAGLMTVAPPGGGEAARAVFERVAGLVAELGLTEASMGMTDDLDEALAAGSTMIRVGRGLFGPRAPRAPVPQ